MVHPEFGPAIAICKIFKVGDIFYAVTGVSFPEYPAIIASARITPDNLRPGLKNFETALIADLEKSLERARKESPAFYKRALGQINETDFVFFGMNETVPVIAVVRFHFESRPDSTMVSVAGEIFLDEPHCPQNALSCGVTLGYNIEAQKYLIDHLEWWTIPNLADAVKLLVQLEIDAEPREVGPPIRVLQIDSKGPRWLQNGEGCATLGPIAAKAL